MGRGDYTIKTKQKVRQRKRAKRLERIATEKRKARQKARR